MPAIIRTATPADAPIWVDLARAVLSDDYPDKQIYDVAWAATELDPAVGGETWFSDDQGKVLAAATIIPSEPGSQNPVANLGRCLFHPESYKDGSAQNLLLKINELAEQRQQLVVARVLASDNPQQILFEELGYVCAGFQPSKHLYRTRQGVLYYLWFPRPDVVSRMQISESLPQVGELATAVLQTLHISNPLTIRDGVTGCPLKIELQLNDATYDDFELWRTQVMSSNPAVEISRGASLGQGLLRIKSGQGLRAILANRDGNVVAGLAYHFDELDRCVRVFDSFSGDDLCIGTLLSHLVKYSQEQLGAVFAEMDAVMTSPRMLKTAEQLGFVPVAYMPAFLSMKGSHVDVVKLAKLNMVYSPEQYTLTAQARTMADLVDRNFQDQKIGVAVINLLRGLPIFSGLGDGELRKIARLFTQKLFRPGEKIFNKGDQGNEAFVVMRGQVDICLEEGAKAIANITNGQIFGELAFLDGAARNAHALASQASILLVVQRSAFNELVQREPHLGMVVMKNIAVELSNRLRKANTSIKK